ncbi:beta-lactamase family protein [Acidaminobacter sp. JC074]|uniref:serine hydrolase domain-containing protein n=1 Tax=Acidaminobacter sp. JC074 TaxID=2530199 RepID=UPI001F10A779|nr:beta-lactamase family protein [Acidaminobacter sp. JC074]MCH4889478.1 beta-lactamase family protein [Acidaminobacter sp. JC074]
MFITLIHTLKEKNYSGVVTIRKDDKILFNEAFGYRDKPNQIENDTSTIFGIASGTKLYTALGIMKLVEKNMLGLESKLFDIIEKPFPSYDESVTIKQALSHTSGLPDYYDEDLIEDFDNFTIETPWHLLEKPSDYFSSMPDRQMKFSPGEGFHYNNGAFVFLAMVIEKLTGDYHKWLEDELFIPLDLNHTGFYRLDALPKNTANGYIETSQGFKTNIYNLPIISGGDGGLFTNSEDLLKLWDDLLANKILSHENTETLLTPHTKTNEDDYYGLGIWLDKEENSIKKTIVGSDAGVSFLSSVFNKDSITLNMLSNTSDGVWDCLKDVREILKDL